jgi:hypothetical protein
MPFLVPAGVSPDFLGACFTPRLFFWAAAVRSDGSGVAAAGVAVESGLGEVSSGKVMLHVMSLETKKFKSSRGDNHSL